MCLVSDKIKFCTCLDGDYEELPHYWLLYRFNVQKNVLVMGLPIMPLDFFQATYELNAKTLCNRLNEKDAFDKLIAFKPKDQLEIVINNLSDNAVDRMTFCFIYKKGKWMEKAYDTFELMSYYDELTFGNFDKLEEE
jgi:hypothetical protein